MQPEPGGPRRVPSSPLPERSMGGPRPVTCTSPDELRSALEADYKARAEENDPCAFVTKAMLVRETDRQPHRTEFPYWI